MQLEFLTNVLEKNSMNKILI